MVYVHKDVKRASKTEKPLGGSILKCAPDYTIYSDGRLWSEKTKKFLTPVVVKSRAKPFYKIVRDGQRMSVNISQLVATHFHPKDPRGKVIEHIDGNVMNCHVLNLKVTDVGSSSKLSWK